MPRKKAIKPKQRKAVATAKTKLTVLPNVPKKERAWWHWTWGESYTSFLLGIVVVIVGVLFGVTLIKQHQNIQDTSSIQATPEITTTPSPTTSVIHMQGGEKVYTVKTGDDLWTIAENFYQSGYNWVDIAKANNLSDPSTIHTGNELVIPSVTPGIQTVTPTQQETSPSPTAQVVKTNGISGNSYTVEKNDDLWNIALRAYGDGYRWVDIAKANNLSNPDMIFSGNVLIIPR